MNSIFQDCRIDNDKRIVEYAYGKNSLISLSVPSFLGEIKSSECRGAYFVVMTQEEKLSFHNSGRLMGLLHWHSIKKVIKNHCIMDAFKKRVDFHITHYHWGKGTKSSTGASGRVAIDKQIICQCSDNPGANGFLPRALGAALANYLYIPPQQALLSGNVIMASLALLDKRISKEELSNFCRHRAQYSSYSIWKNFYSLRYEQG